MMTPLFLLEPIEGPLTSLLEWFHTAVGLPWAWSIVALTILVRMVLVPLTVKQIHSMQSMQAHMPEMKAIQQRYKDDKQKRNEELMKFYKENKVNPAASCLPILFQIPVFISLFFVLRDFENEVLPNYRRDSRSALAQARPEHHRPGELALVRVPAAGAVRDQPDAVHAAHVPDDGQDAADAAADPADRLSLRRPQLPVRARPLLGDHEPVDGRPGPDHAAPGAEEVDRARQALVPHAAEGGGARSRRPSPLAKPAQPSGRRGA